MSRSLRTMPFAIQKEKREKWRTIMGSYPPAIGGMNQGMRSYARRRNRQFRRLATVLLQTGQEEKIPATKKRVAWDIW